MSHRCPIAYKPQFPPPCWLPCRFSHAKRPPCCGRKLAHHDGSFRRKFICVYLVVESKNASIEVFGIILCRNADEHFRRPRTISLRTEISEHPSRAAVSLIV